MIVSQSRTAVADGLAIRACDAVSAPLRIYASMSWDASALKNAKMMKRTQFHSKHAVLQSLTTKKFLFLPKANLMIPNGTPEAHACVVPPCVGVSVAAKKKTSVFIRLPRRSLGEGRGKANQAIASQCQPLQAFF